MKKNKIVQNFTQGSSSRPVLLIFIKPEAAFFLVPGGHLLFKMKGLKLGPLEQPKLFLAAYVVYRLDSALSFLAHRGMDT